MSWRATFVIVLACATACGACGAFASEPDVVEPAVDAGTDGALDAAAPDDADAGPPADGASADAGPCDLAAPFGPPSLLLSVGSANFTATLTEDEHVILFDNLLSGPSRWAIFVSKRGSLAETFNTASEITGPVALVTNDTYNPALSADGLTLLFMSNRVSGQYHLWSAKRASPLVDFGTPALAPMLSSGTAAQDRQPFVATDDAVWFTSERPTVGGTTDIFRAAATDGGYATPARVTELSSSANEAKPVLSRDGLTAFFGSDRSAGKGGVEIWSATRASTSDVFGAPALVSELNSPSNDFPTWISADSCRLYITSDRSATRRIYVASRPAR